MASTKVEFAVQMTCESCVNKIKNAVEQLNGVEKVDISLEKGTVVIQSNLPSSLIQNKIESTGRKAVLKGYGSGKDDVSLSSAAAVAMLGGNTGYGAGTVRGIVRFVQLDPESCVIEGTIDGLTPGEHGLHVHECGDITEGCNSVGDHLNLFGTKHGGPMDNSSNRHTGDLGNIIAEDDGRASFRLVDKLLKVYDAIGRSIVVTSNMDDLGRGSSPISIVNGNSGERLACGVISRSAGLFENTKKICACDGLTLWDERDRPAKNNELSQGVSVPTSSLCTYL
ncbi:copper chaperone for superoxide dismutase [Lycorma delicatula]|uniref:copper chaperone for superoxide dismutase n=1 Tax=Lycorma delicatula TaxID=130591 RepID=UPI003F50EE72